MTAYDEMRFYQRQAEHQVHEEWRALNDDLYMPEDVSTDKPDANIAPCDARTITGKPVTGG